ncbi:hypothetical protein BC940DRAFT_350922 [Gongronella butleri]|nr:hypothetical protein BC940DRAFT_350922 [Gongronella butleri]
MVVRLPSEILRIIVDQLPVNDLLAVRRVNSTLCAIATPLAASKGRVVFHSEKHVLDFVKYFELGNSILPFQSAAFMLLDGGIRTSLMIRFCHALVNCRNVQLERFDNFIADNDSTLREMFLTLKLLPSLEGLIVGLGDDVIVNDLDYLLPTRLKRLHVSNLRSNASGVCALQNILKRLPMLQELKMTITDGKIDGQHLVQWMADNPIPWHQSNLETLELRVDACDNEGALFPYVLLVFLLTSFQLHSLRVYVYYEETDGTVQHPVVLPRLPSSLVMNLPNSLHFSGDFTGAGDPEQSQLRSLFSDLKIQGVLDNVELKTSMLHHLLNLLPISSVRSVLTWSKEPGRTGLLAPFLERAQNLSRMDINCNPEIQFDQDEIASWVREERRFSLQNLRFWRLHVQCLSSLESLAEVCPNLHSLSIYDLRVDHYSYTPIMLENYWMQMLVTMFAGSVPWISLPFRNLHLYYLMEHERNTLHIVLQDQRYSALPLQLYMGFYQNDHPEGERRRQYVKISARDVEWFKNQLHQWSKASIVSSTNEIDTPSTFPSQVAQSIFKCIKSNDLVFISCKSLATLDALWHDFFSS